MKRRLYFLFPDADHTRIVIDELHEAGIDTKHMHAMARDGVDVQSLPPATARQRRDVCCRVENLLWNANLVVFGIALAALAFAAWQSSWTGALAALTVLAATFFVGERFAATIPRAHLHEFREAIAHGEVLLMVDVPPERVAEVEDIVHRRHPEAVVGGVGWSVEALEH